MHIKRARTEYYWGSYYGKYFPSMFCLVLNSKTIFLY